MEIDLWPSTETNNILGCSEVFHTFLFRGITASQLAHITENKKARYLSSWCFKSLFSFPDPISALVLDPNSRMHPLRKKVVTASVNFDFLRGQFNSFISLGIYKRSPMSQTLCRAGGGAWGIRSLFSTLKASICPEEQIWLKNKRIVMPVALVQGESRKASLGVEGTWAGPWWRGMMRGGRLECSSHANALLSFPVFFPFLLFSFTFDHPAFLTIMMLFNKLALSRAKPKVVVVSGEVQWCWLRQGSWI